MAPRRGWRLLARRVSNGTVTRVTEPRTEREISGSIARVGKTAEQWRKSVKADKQNATIRNCITNERRSSYVGCLTFK